eukprot:1683320-Alexandrium_andersonii.AAC.1
MKAAVELMPAVRKTRRAGVFKVPSSKAGESYTVEVELKATPGTVPARLVQSCECRDRVKNGPICKRAGAVLHALAAESREAPKQLTAQTAS